MARSKKRRDHKVLVNHRHCMTCGRAIPPDKKFCSEECRRRYEEARMRERRMRKMLWIIYAVMIGALLIMILIRAMIH